MREWEGCLEARLEDRQQDCGCQSGSACCMIPCQWSHRIWD